MKEKELIKKVTDRQMPDLEAIRKKCVEQTESKPSKAKILTFKSSRFAAAVAVCVFALGGMIAALAMPGGIFFRNEPEEKPAETAEVVETESETTKETEPLRAPYRAENGSSSRAESGDKKDDADDNTPSDDSCLKRMQDAGYEIDELYDLGTVGEYNVCLAKQGDTKNLSCEYIIGDYVFSLDSKYYPYGPALFAVGTEQVYTLADAYDDSIFGDDFDEVVELIENAENVGDFSVKVSDIGGKEIRFREILNNPGTLTLANLGTVGETEIFFNITDTFVEGESEIKVGDYTFEMKSSQAEYPLGLFVVCNDEVYTLEDALDSKLIDDLDAVMRLVDDKIYDADYNWTLVMPESSADDGVDSTEEETNDEIDVKD